MEYHIVEPGDL